MFVYIIDRYGELDVYADLDDALKASEITGLPYVEQSVFASSAEQGSTREWLDELRVDHTR